MTFQIPPPRIPVSDPKTGQMSRIWFRYLEAATSGFVGEDTDASEFFTHIEESRVNVSPGNSVWHILGTGIITVYLPKSSDRSSVLTVTNVGSGVITIAAETDELISGDSTKTLDFQWTTVQLCPTDGGWVIL